MATGISSYSKTAADNASASSQINMAEGMSPGAVNDGVRQVMADVAEWRDDTGGALATTGSANTYVVTGNGSVEALAAGARLCVRINATNTSASTLNPNSLGAKAIRKIVGGADVDVDAGDLQAGQAYDLVYVTSLNSSAGGWLLVGLVNAKGYRYGSRQVLSGASNWTRPAGCRAILVRMRASGGGGGGATGGSSQAGVGSGGGQGEYAEKFIVGPASTVAYSIGAAGAGASAAGTSGNGSDGSACTWDSGPLFSAGGGKAGLGLAASTAGVGVLGGQGGSGGTAGDLNVPGAPGQNGIRFSGTSAISGKGGGEGGGQGANNADTNGSAGSSGGGGGGAASLTTAQRAGGTGGTGWIIVEEFY